MSCPAGRQDVARYEQLRARALDGDPGGWQLGLAVLEHRGVVAWTRAWQSTAPAPTRGAPPEPVAVSGELVGSCWRAWHWRAYQEGERP